MSIIFSVESEATTFEQALAGLPPEVMIDGGPTIEFSGPVPPDQSFLFYVAGASTRGVELSQNGGMFEVRTLSASCEADYDLAFRCLENVAGPGQTITCDDGREVTREDLRTTFDVAWMREIAASSLAMVVAGIKSQGMTMSLAGPNGQNFVIGPRVLADIFSPASFEAMGPFVLDGGYEEEEAPSAIANLQGARFDEAPFENVSEEEVDHAVERLFVRMREFFYFDRESVFTASVFENESGTMSVWPANCRCLFDMVTYLSPAAGEEPNGAGELILVPYTALTALAGEDRVRFIDDGHAIVEAIPDDEWPNLLDRARVIADALEGEI